MIVIYYTLLYYTILHYTILYYTILIFHVSFACIVLFVQPTSTSPIYPSSWERTKAALRASLGERRRWTNGEPYWNIYRIYIWIVLKHQNNWLFFFRTSWLNKNRTRDDGLLFHVYQGISLTSSARNQSTALRERCCF